MVQLAISYSAYHHSPHPSQENVNTIEGDLFLHGFPTFLYMKENIDCIVDIYFMYFYVFYMYFTIFCVTYC